MATKSNKLTLQFDKFKEHKKVVRYMEAGDDDEQVIGSIYVKKEALEKLGNPPTLNVTVEP